MTRSMELSEVQAYLKERSAAGNPGKILVFLEHASHVDYLPALESTGALKDVLCIATTPDTCFALDSKNLNYVPVDDFITHEEINSIGLLNFSYVETYCGIIDSHLRSRYPEFSRYSLNVGRDNFPYFKILFDEITIKTRILENIIKTESPALVLTFSKNNPATLSGNIPFQHEDHLFDLLLSCKGWPRAHISITGLPVMSGEIQRTNRLILPVLKLKIRSASPVFYSVLSIYHNSGFLSALSFLYNTLKNIFRPKKTACIVSFGYNWDLVIPQLAQNQYRVVYLDIIPPKKEKKVPEDFHFPRDHIRKLLKTGVIDPTDLVIEYTLPKITDAVGSIAEFSEKIEKFFTQHRPCVLLYSTKNTFSDTLPVHVAETHGIPVVSWQHGASGFFSFYPILRFTELSGSDVHLVWGSGVKDQIEKEFPSNECQIIPLGSFELQETFLKCRKETKDHSGILYVTTNHFHNTLYVGYSHRIQDIHFWNTQKKILDALGTCDVPAIFKIHPSTHNSQLFYNYLLGKKFKHIMIVRNEIRLDCLLVDASIVIIDFPSTTLLQAIAAKKTIFVLFKHITMTPRAKILLQKRAYCYEEPDDLTCDVRKYLKNEPLDQSPDPDNTEFLEHYGINTTEGMVAIRVINALDNVVSSAH